MGWYSGLGKIHAHSAGVSRTKRIRCRGTETKLPSRTSGASVGTEARSGSFKDMNALRTLDPPRRVRGPKHWSRQSRSSGRAEIHQIFPRGRSRKCGASILSRVHSFEDGGSTMRLQWLIGDLLSVVPCPQICTCMTWRRQDTTHTSRCSSVIRLLAELARRAIMHNAASRSFFGDQQEQMWTTEWWRKAVAADLQIRAKGSWDRGAPNGQITAAIARQIYIAGMRLMQSGSADMPYVCARRHSSFILCDEYAERVEV